MSFSPEALDGIAGASRVALCLGFVAAAAAYDWHQTRIPNRLVLSGFVSALALNGCLALAGGEAFLGQSLLGAIVGLAILLPAYVLRSMGAGDVKLLALAGAFVGPIHVIGVALASFIVGGVLGIALAWRKGVLGQVLGNVRLIAFLLLTPRAGSLAADAFDRRGMTPVKLPFGLAIAGGAISYTAIFFLFPK